MSAERPILFSAPMVLALLAGMKTQTRRIAKFQQYEEGREFNLSFSGLDAGFYHSGMESSGWVLRSRGRGGCWNDRTKPLHCPYGKNGERLWVKETWAHFDAFPGDMPGTIEPEFTRGVPKKPTRNIAYRADDGWEDFGPWLPSIFMTRWASRITLAVTASRVERLCSITEDDAKAEGVELGETSRPPSHRGAYAELWDRINGAGSWNSNPWVWVISFQPLPVTKPLPMGVLR